MQALARPARTGAACRARRAPLVGDARPPLELGLALAEAGDVDGARAWIARLRAAAPDSTFVNQLEIPQVLAALALARRASPSEPSRPCAPVGSLDLSYTASALYLRTRALRELGRLPRGDGRSRADAGAPVAASGRKASTSCSPLEFARAAAGAGDAAKARAGLPGCCSGCGRQADADFTLLRQARAELAALGS